MKKSDRRSQAAWTDTGLRSRYDTAGFAVVPQLLTIGDVERAANTSDAIVASWEVSPPPRLTVCPALHWEKPSPEASSSLLHGPLLSVIQHLADTILQAPAEVSARIFFKAPGAAATTPHQDSAYAPNPLAHRLNIWIPLEPVDVENGCLFYYSGSHTAGPQTHRVDPRDPCGNTLTIADLPPGDPIPVPLKPGGAVIHHQYNRSMTNGEAVNHLRTRKPLEF